MHSRGLFKAFSNVCMRDYVGAVSVVGVNFIGFLCFFMFSGSGYGRRAGVLAT